MDTWTFYLVISSLVFLVFAVFFIYILIESLRNGIVFRPTRTYLNNVGDYQDTYVGDVMTRWYDNESDTVLFYLHGNSGNISDRGYVVEFAQLAGVNLVLIDYRGYGESRGTPSIANMREDADAVFEVIKEKYASDKILIMSESLGSIPASYLSSRHPVRAILVLAGISSFKDIAEGNGRGWMKTVANLVLGSLDRSDTNNELFSRSLSPIMFVHSEKDEVVPYQCALKNHEVTESELVVIEGGHSTPEIGEAQLVDMLKFLHLPTNDPQIYSGWRARMRDIGKMPNFRIVA